MQEPHRGIFNFKPSPQAVSPAPLSATLQKPLPTRCGEHAEREDASYAAAVDEVVGQAETLGVVAKMIVQELAAERAENARLPRALKQRQDFIERTRRQRGS